LFARKQTVCSKYKEYRKEYRKPLKKSSMFFLLLKKRAVAGEITDRSEKRNGLPRANRTETSRGAGACLSVIKSNVSRISDTVKKY